MKLYELLENAGAEEYDWITVQAAAKIIGVSVCTIYNKVNAGELETKHIKSAVRVRKSEILKINDL
jgi:excisionase family DNA binding protein